MSAPIAPQRPASQASAHPVRERPGLIREPLRERQIVFDQIPAAPRAHGDAEQRSEHHFD